MQWQHCIFGIFSLNFEFIFANLQLYRQLMPEREEEWIEWTKLFIGMFCKCLVQKLTCHFKMQLSPILVIFWGFLIVATLADDWLWLPITITPGVKRPIDSQCLLTKHSSLRFGMVIALRMSWVWASSNGSCNTVACNLVIQSVSCLKLIRL